MTTTVATRTVLSRAARPVLEGLEARQLLAANDPLTVTIVSKILTVTGTATDDTIVATRNSATSWTITNGTWSLTKTGTISGVKVLAGAGNDAVTVSSMAVTGVTLFGQAGNDTLTGSANTNDSMDGGDGNDSLVGNGGNDTLVGLAGNDTLIGAAGNDSLLGGVGDDSIDGGDGNDVLNGDVGNDTLSGGAGNDTLTGLAGTDSLLGGSGNDVLNGGTENDTLDGGANDDRLDGGLGADSLAGGSGKDTIDYSTRLAASPLTISLDDAANDGASGELDNVASDFEVVLGGAGNDTITGTSGNDTLNGLAGNDSILGGDGDDSINGGAGNDQLFGEGDNDFIDGGLGNDLINGGDGVDTLIGMSGGTFDTLTGGDGTDNFWLDAAETITDLDSTETALGAAKRIASFVGNVSKDLLGQAIADPKGKVGSKLNSFRSYPLFSSNGPAIDDINQGQAGSCWWLSTCAAVAKTNPELIKQNITDFKDGTYGVRLYTLTGTQQFVRVDADLFTYSWSTTTPFYASFGAQNSIWVAIYEKALAMVRGAKAGQYVSVDGGWMDEAFRRIGMSPANTNKGNLADATALSSLLNTAFTAGKAVTVGFLSVPGGLNLVGYHAYTIDRLNDDGTVTLRNPWGVDNGTSTDGNNDGYVTLTVAQLLSAMTTISIA
ncbi:MAG: C2 family cysteine protease [Tepidisphaeraceae bacterium]